METGDRFGTNATFFVSYGFGGVSPSSPKPFTPEQRLWGRVAEPLQRQPTLRVITQTEGTALQSVVAQDADGNDYVFRHVDPATGTATGAEAAIATIANNNLADNTGNGIAVELLGAGQAAQITIAGNTVQNSGTVEAGNPRGDGIQVAGAGTYTVNQLIITNNTTAANQDEGIDITFIDAARLNSALVQGNQISANSGDGLGLRA